MIANTEILNYLWRSLKTAQTADTKLHAVWALTNLAIDCSFLYQTIMIMMMVIMDGDDDGHGDKRK